MKSFDSTYEGLKPQLVHRIAQGIGLIVSTVPMRA